MKKYIGMIVCVVFAVGGTVAVSQDEDVKPKPIKEVMKAHKGGPKSLLAKVVSGKGSDAENKELLSLYTDLAKNKPPKGDEAAWKKVTGRILAAAKGVVAGEKGAGKLLAKATNCKNCHTAHKA